MPAEEELTQLRQQKRWLQEQVDAQGKTILLQQEQISALMKQMQELQARLAKDSHNSHLPLSSDRFARQPSLRKKSGKKPGGQEGHPGAMLTFSQTPDEVIVHAVERCDYCQHDLKHLAPVAVERRQVIDLPPLHAGARTSG
ncbi:MAG TPA: DUF6444 domain-containing protein [Ktedonobacteraceae bacterium]|jgi:transposase|nr:DUF6444 domain-containing protein [Ktedonobacteraceae bacterium]